MTSKKDDTVSKKRKPVPKKIDREIKVEAGHKCAIWNCSESYGLEKHHIDGDPSNNNKDNIIFPIVLIYTA